MILPLPNLGVKGLNTDVAPWDLPPEFITDGANFRLSNNALISYGSYGIMANTPTPYAPGYASVASPKSGSFYVLAGKQAIMTYLGGTYADITNTPFEVDEFEWSGCLNGSIIVLNNWLTYPSYWDGAGAMKPLPWDIESGASWEDVQKSCDVIRGHKNYLIALSLHEAVDKPDSFRWSHPADENGIPFTWDPDEPSGLAGIQALGGDGGKIIDGLSQRDSFVIYSENAINILRLSGDEFVWNRQELSSTIGVLSKDCIADVKGIHYILTRGDIVTFDGNTIASIAHGRIRTRLNAKMNTEYAYRAFVVRNDRDKELWFCVPEGDSEHVTTAYIYQWKEQAWSIRDLPTGTGFVLTAPSATSAQSWADAPLTWGARLDKWVESISEVSFEESPYAVNNVNSELHHLDALEPVIDLNTVLERTDLAIDGQQQVTTITRLYPHIRGSVPVRVQVGSQDRPNGSVRWQPYQLFDPTKDRKLDIRTTGALHSWRVMSEGAGAFIFAGLDVEYQQDGIK